MIYSYENECNGHTPYKGPLHRLPDHMPVPGTDVTSDERFTCIGEPVRKVGEYHQEFHQDGTHSQQSISVAGRNYGKSDIYGDETERAHEEVGIHAHEAAHLTALEYSAQVSGAQCAESIPAITQQKADGSDQEPGILCDNSSGCDSAETHSLIPPSSYTESQRKNNAHKDVHSVYRDVRQHGAHAVLHAYEPALQGHQTEGRWSRPYADEEILRGQVTYLRSAVDEQEGSLDEYPLDGYKEEGA